MSPFVLVYLCTLGPSRKLFGLYLRSEWNCHQLTPIRSKLVSQNSVKMSYRYALVDQSLRKCRNPTCRGSCLRSHTLSLSKNWFKRFFYLQFHHRSAWVCSSSFWGQYSLQSSVSQYRFPSNVRYPTDLGCSAHRHILHPTGSKIECDTSQQKFVWFWCGRTS